MRKFDCIKIKFSVYHRCITKKETIEHQKYLQQMETTKGSSLLLKYLYGSVIVVKGKNFCILLD